MKRFRLKILILALFAFTIILLGSLSLYKTVEANSKLGIKLLIFSIIYIFIVLVLFFVFKEVDKKNEDIESSKRYYYYSKPYIFLIDNKGKVRSYNKTIEENVLNYLNYSSIYDFDCDFSQSDILDEISRQKSFICKFKSVNNEEIVIRFLPTKINKGFYLIGENITDQYNSYTYHKNLALYNEITSLPNKNYFLMKLNKLLDDKNLSKNKNTIVSFDIVGFKKINRLFGLKIGDETLKILSNLASKSLINHEAELFNVELDNFLVLFTNLNKYQDVIDWVNEFSQQFERAIEISGNMFTITLKVGIFHLEIDKHPELTAVDAYENVQLALRKSKESRRFLYSVYDVTLGKNFTRAQTMEVDLASAIKKDEFRMFLQPILNNQTNKIIGFEALLRWINPKYMYESPATFIEIAERNNFIVDIGRYIIDETFRIAKLLEPHQMKISINISPVQILQTGFVHEFINAFSKHNLKKGSICIEITETFLMESLEAIIEKLTLIQRSGINIHLDNFGTGYSSMLYLKELPINGISINREFIKNLNNDDYSKNIVKQIIGLAKNLNLDIVAEGVENETQNKFLKDNGCNIVQGYLISEPLQKEDAIKFMLDFNNKRIVRSDRL